MRSLTIQEKLEIIESVENGKSIKEMSEETGINRNSLHYILKNRNKIREEVGKNPTLSKHKRLKQTKNPQLEAEILKFIYEAREKGEKLTGNIIKAVALETSIKMGISNFGASNGWLFSFFKRNGININDFNKSNMTSQHDVAMNEVIETEDNSYYVTSEVQYEIEYAQQELSNDANDTSEYTEINEYHCDWRDWCKFCGFDGQTEVLEGADYENYQFLKTLIKFNQLDNDIRCCQKCQSSLEQSCKFLMMAKRIENMFIELDEHERLNSLTEENVEAIRQHHMNDSSDQQQEQALDEEDSKQIIYEEDYLEEAAEFKNVEAYELIQENIDDNTEQHSDELIPKTDDSQMEEEQFVYDCHVCGENFARMCFLSNHTRLSHSCLPQVACICGKFLATWDSLMAHKRKHSNEPADWVCDICNAKFQTKTGLSIHIKFKHNQKKQVQYVCNICKKEFSDATVLRNHARSHALIEEKFQYECSFCMKRLSTKYSLKTHIQSVHEKQVTIFCHLCSKGFTNKSNLRSHLISHTTEYITCDVCNQVFKNRISYQSHKKVHKPKESLNFACNYCDKKFHNRNHLDRHLRSHSNIKNYKCNKCDAAYKWEKDLKNHESVHTGEEMKNQCEYCARLFNDVSNLRKHKLRHHQDEMTEYEVKYGKRSSV